MSISYGVFPQEREVQSQIWVLLSDLLLIIVSYFNK